MKMNQTKTGAKLNHCFFSSLFNEEIIKIPKSKRYPTNFKINGYKTELELKQN